MKSADYYWEHPQLTKYVKNIPAGQYLFKQGQYGTTMFVIVKGLVDLIAERDGREYLIGLIPVGQFLGEKAVIQDKPYRRAFGARAKVDTTVLELDLTNIESVRKAVPDVMNDILGHMFLIAAERLDRANYLINGLRYSHNADRIVYVIIYFSRSTGRPSPRGAEFLLRLESIHYYVDIPVAQIREFLVQLIQKKLLIQESEDFFVLPSERALLESLPQVKERIKAKGLDGFDFDPAP